MPIVVAFAAGLSQELGAELVRQIFGNNESAMVKRIVAQVKEATGDAFDRFQVQSASAEVEGLATRIRQYSTADRSEAEIYAVYDGSAQALHYTQQTGPYANSGPNRFQGLWGHHLFLTVVSLRATIVQDLIAKTDSRERKGRHANNLSADLDEAIGYAEKLERRWKAWHRTRFGPLLGSVGGTGRLFSFDGKFLRVPPLRSLTRQAAASYREEQIDKEWKKLHARIVGPSEQVRAHWALLRPKRGSFLWRGTGLEFGERRLPVAIPQPA